MSAAIMVIAVVVGGLFALKGFVDGPWWRSAVRKHRATILRLGHVHPDTVRAMRDDLLQKAADLERDMPVTIANARAAAADLDRLVKELEAHRDCW